MGVWIVGIKPDYDKEKFREGLVLGAYRCVNPILLILFSELRGLASNVIPRDPDYRDDEESVGGAGGAQIVPTTPRPFAPTSGTQGDMDAGLLGQSRIQGGRGVK